jgi:hypothetical protein
MLCYTNYIYKYCHIIKQESSLTLLINEDRFDTQPGDGYFFKLLKTFFSKYLRNKYKYFHTIYTDNTNLSQLIRLPLLLVLFYDILSSDRIFYIQHKARPTATAMLPHRVQQTICLQLFVRAVRQSFTAMCARTCSLFTALPKLT